MKYTNLAGLLMAVGGILIIFNIVFAGAWEGFLGTLIEKSIFMWIGVGLIVISFIIMLLKKKK